MLTDRKLWNIITDYRTTTSDSRLNGKFLTVENIVQCLDLFDKINGFVGVFKEILSEIKNDLTEAIFSQVLTVNESINREKIERIPYFILFINLLEKQKFSNLEFEKLIEKLNEKLLLQEENLKLITECKKEKENDCLKFEKQINLYQLEMSKLQKELDELTEVHLESKNNMHQEINQIIMEKNQLKNELLKQNAAVDNLQGYKDAHEHLDKSFMDACHNYQDEEVSGDPFDKKANLEMEIKTAISMDNDLLILENLMLNDFDRRITEFKNKIMDQKYSLKYISDIPNIEDQKADEIIARAIMDFNKAKLHFKEEFQQLQMESLMLQNHQAVLVNDWSTIIESEIENGSKQTDDHRDIKASYIIDDRIMSKYSAIIYISNDGENFYECKGVRFCESCGNKSLICPHNMHQLKKIIQLPVGSTHIKIERPQVKINSKYSKYFVSKSQFSIEEKSETNISNEERKQSSRKSFRSSVCSSDSETMIAFDSLLEDYQNRTKMKRISPKKFNEEQILSIVEDFWATILNEDEYDSQLSEITTLLDKLYLFFLDRYADEKAAMLSLHDFFTGIVEIAAFSQIIQLLCHVLIANIDSSVMRYLFHIVDCIEMVNWKNEEDLRFFLTTVHPFISEDDIDSIILSYISYSENIYDKSHIFEFILYNFLKQRDPRFNWVKSEATDLKTSNPGFFTFNEFQVLLDSLTSLPNKKLSIRLFKELAVFYTDEGFIETAPTSKISEIIAFLSFLESVENIKQSLQARYADFTGNKNEQIKWSFNRLTDLASKLLREK